MFKETGAEDMASPWALSRFRAVVRQPMDDGLRLPLPWILRRLSRGSQCAPHHPWWYGFTVLQRAHAPGRNGPSQFHSRCCCPHRSLEEVLIVEKRFMLKEELHIAKRRVETHTPQRVTVRSEEVTVERIENPPQKEGR